MMLRFIIHDHDNLFVSAKAVYSAGIIYKVMKENTCVGLSLKSQELTAMFLAVILYCIIVLEYYIHTLLDLATLVTTLCVLYMIRFNLKSSYMKDKHSFASYYVPLDECRRSTKRGGLSTNIGFEKPKGKTHRSVGDLMRRTVEESCVRALLQLEGEKKTKRKVMQNYRR